MRKLARWLAVLLLALWVPVTMHCELEAMPQFSFLQCCCGTEEASNAPSDCADTVCSAVEAGFCKLEDDQTVTPAAVVLMGFTAPAWESEEIKCPLQPPRPEPQPPPELARFWQFSCRTALSPRAPSVIA